MPQLWHAHPSTAAIAHVRTTRAVPLCTCGAPQKLAVAAWGQQPDPARLEHAKQLAAACDLVLVLGSTLTGSLNVHSNPKLKSLAGFGALGRIDGNFDVRSNAALTSGLTVTTEIDGLVYVYDNDALTTLGLGTLTTLGSNFSVDNNNALPTCQATSVRDALLTGGWKGTATITNNLADACKL
jgi:hypothetical protein